MIFIFIFIFLYLVCKLYVNFEKFDLYNVIYYSILLLIISYFIGVKISEMLF